MQLGSIGSGRKGEHMLRRWLRGEHAVVGCRRIPAEVEATVAMHFGFGGHLETGR